MATIWSGWYWQLGLASFIAMGGAIAALSDCAHAQITPDVTLGAESSVVTPTNVNGIPSEQIDGGAARGANLFHSFDEFSVPNGGEAFFNNAPDIQNIFSRVTGGSISNIDGLLRANGTANLFLLNPNGIIFGPNASLNIGGSFMGSTARSLNFVDGTQFSATAPQATPLLTINVPIGLQYGANPGRIQVQGNGQGLRTTTDVIDTTTGGLRVQPNQTLAIVGGDIALLGGTLKAAGGRIELGSVAGDGLVNLTPTTTGWALGYEGVPTFGEIQLSGAATVDAGGAGGGDITVRGRQVTLTNGSQIQASTLGAEPGGTLSIATERLSVQGGAYVSNDTFGSGDGGTLSVSASDIEVIGRSANDRTSSRLSAGTFGDGKAGNLTIATGRLSVRDGARISSSTNGSGDGGTLSVSAADFVELIGTSANGQFPSGLYAQTGDGKASNLTIATGRLSVRDGARISSSTNGSGDGGTLSVSAADFVELIGTSADGRIGSGLHAQTNGDGKAGNLTIATGRLSVKGGAQISSSTNGSGDGGTLSVSAADVIELIGRSANGQFPSGLYAQTNGDGKAGNLTIATGRLSVKGGAQVSAGTRSTGAGGILSVSAADVIELIGRSANSQFPSGLYALTEGEGKAGDLRIATGRLTVKGGAQVSAGTRSTGAGGTLSVSAADVVEVIGRSANSQFPSGLFTSTQGEGKAGDLRIATGRLTVRDGAVVSAGTNGSGDGGTLSVSAADFVELIGRSAVGRFSTGLFTQTEGEGKAGDLRIATGRLSVQGGAQVSAGTNGTGAGGTLSVSAADVIELIGTSANSQFPSGLFTSTEGEGKAGDLRIATGRLTVRDGAQVTVNSQGSGNAGSLRVAAGSLLLENQGKLLASTASGEGGNIDLQVQDLILMRRNSLISAEAGGRGNGGNISINAPFIVAVTAEDSDIFANAILGRGGNINITTQGIYGLEYRSSLTSESDINASSEFGVEGTVEINNPDVDPAQGLVELPAELVDASNQIATSCSAAGENEFIITGRGGLPPNPRQVLSSNAVQVDWVELSASRENRSSTKPATNPTTESAPTTIVEANGWVKGPNGEVTLFATAPTANIDIPWLPESSCNAPEPES